ncbi:MAG: GspE/PulE family protein [Planctomycetota bacterium]|jgi:type IV pilus assembly protein PilB
MAEEVAQRERPLEHMLVEMGLISYDQLSKAIELSEERDISVKDAIVALDFVSEEQVLAAIADRFGMSRIDLSEFTEIAPEILNQISPTVADTYKVVPIVEEGGELVIALGDPFNVNVMDDLRFLMDRPIRGVIVDPEQFQAFYDKYYSGQVESVESILSDIEAEGGSQMAVTIDSAETIDLESIEEMADAAPVRRLVSLVLLQAIKDRASDIHFEPFEDEFKIRYRIDGVLYEMVPPPKHLALAITSRIKVMSNLDIAERRMPQDGRIELNVSGRPVDLRVAILPTMFGESVVLRVLDRAAVSLDLNRLGLREDDLERVREHFYKPHGIVLVTGPTGCGKTTTLYSALVEMNKITDKIITTEDPVEYDLPGIMQVQIRADIGVTFASCLRSILRQDPDRILVGEIRDLETAEMAVQASLTGHIVLSTLHTNDAPTAVTRVVDMGLEPFLVTATLECIVAQRLVRTICPRCKTDYSPGDEELMELGLTHSDVENKQFFYGKGCNFCNNTGYKGRTGIFEIMMINDEMRDLIMHEASTAALREAAIRNGMRTMRESGLLAIYDGITAIEEVVKQTIMD